MFVCSYWLGGKCSAVFGRVLNVFSQENVKSGWRWFNVIFNLCHGAECWRIKVRSGSRRISSVLLDSKFITVFKKAHHLCTLSQMDIVHTFSHRFSKIV